MPYVAKTNGTNAIMELRQGYLAQIPEADRANWVQVQEQTPAFDAVGQMRGAIQFAVNAQGDSVQMIHQSIDMPAYWRRMKLKERAAQKRWDVETGGVTFAGMPIPTDDRAKVLIQGAASTVADEDSKTFVLGSSKVTLTGTQFRAVWAAIVAHVDQCFAAQGAIYDAIDADEITTTAAIDSYQWPGA